MNVSFGAVPDQMVPIIRNGLEKTRTPKNIIVIGSGMTGLVTASLLKGAGHHIKVVEASDRIGGRVRTLRAPFSKGLYLDAGAMRIPRQHHLTFEYIKKFQLPINRFYNSTPHDIILTNKVKTRMQHYKQHPAILRFPLHAHEKGNTADELLWKACGPAFHFLKQNPDKQELFSQFSMLDMLKDNRFGIRLSPGAIDAVQVLLDIEAFSELSFLEIFLTSLLPIFLYPNHSFYEITGGNDGLPTAFYPYLRDNLYLEQRVTRIVQNQEEVSVHTKHLKTGNASQFTGDLAIITIPFNALQFVEIEPYHSVSYSKWRAIRELHYSSSIKTGIEFKSRFWEKEGLHGGKVVTDLPTRFSYFFPVMGSGNPDPQWYWPVIRGKTMPCPGKACPNTNA